MDEPGGGVGRAVGLAGGVGREEFGAALACAARFGLRDEALEHLGRFLIREERFPRGKQPGGGAPDHGDRRRLDARLRRFPLGAYR